MHPNLFASLSWSLIQYDRTFKDLKRGSDFALDIYWFSSVCRKSCLGTSESMSPPFQQRIYYFPHAHSQPPPKSNDLRQVVKTETLFGLKSHFWRCAIADPPNWILKTRLQLFFASTYLYQLPAYLCARRWGLSSRTISWDTAWLCWRASWCISGYWL